MYTNVVPAKNQWELQDCNGDAAVKLKCGNSFSTGVKKEVVPLKMCAQMASFVPCGGNFFPFVL